MELLTFKGVPGKGQGRLQPTRWPKGLPSRPRGGRQVPGHSGTAVGALSWLLPGQGRETTKDGDPRAWPRGSGVSPPELTSRSGAPYSPKPTALARGRGTPGSVALRPLRLPSDPARQEESS